jgi:hypothetical protein
MQNQKLWLGVDYFLQRTDKFSHMHFALVAKQCRHNFKWKYCIERLYETRANPTGARHLDK